MLKTGIYLLTASSAGVMYRSADLSYSMTPGLKWLCLTGLSVSLFCFMATYRSFEAARIR